MRIALRSLRRHPMLAGTVFATVALGIGIATALFLYLDYFLHPRLAAPASERIGSVYFGTPDDSRPQASFVEFQRLRQTPVFADTLATSPIGASVGTGEGSRYAWGSFVDGSYFAFFGAHAFAGRLLAGEDDQPGATPVVVLGNVLWRDFFGADRGVIGRPIRINGTMLTVVGVVPAEFAGLGYAASFFIPLRQADLVSGVPRLQAADERWLRLMTRLPNGETVDRARAMLGAISNDLDHLAPLAVGQRKPLLLEAMQFDPENRNDPFFQAARILAGAALLFLVLGSANIAGLLQASVSAREREWAVRKALGAPPLSLVRGVVAENAPAAVAGLAAAFGVATIVARWLDWMLQTPLGGIGEGWSAGQRLLELDVRAVAFAGTAALLAMGGALLPSLIRILRDDPNRALRAGDSHTTARLNPRQVLVGVELALAVLLIVGGSLLARSLAAAAHGDLGFKSHGLATSTIYLPRTTGGQTPMAAWNSLLDRVRHLPAVDSATIVHVAPNAGWSRATQVATIENPNAEHSVQYNLVASQYFATLGLPLEFGRPIDERDAPHAPPVAVVSHSLATLLYPGQSALGRRVRVAGPQRPTEAGPDFEIVGVAADAATTSALEPHAPTLYFAYGQRTHARMALVVRSAVPLAILEPRLRTALRLAAPNAAVVDLVSADEQYGRSLYPFRINATLATGLAGMALATAVAGLLALQSFAVNLRRREFGIRIALGSQRAQIARLVLRDSARLGLLGAAGGIGGALLVTRWLRSLLYGVGALDPWVFGVVPVALFAVVLVAGWMPSRRAMRANPADVLRSL